MGSELYIDRGARAPPISPAGARPPHGMLPPWTRPSGIDVQ